MREDLVPLFLREHLLFVDDEFMQGLAGEEAFASDVRAGLVAEVGLENRDGCRASPSRRSSQCLGG